MINKHIFLHKYAIRDNLVIFTKMQGYNWVSLSSSSSFFIVLSKHGLETFPPPSLVVLISHRSTILIHHRILTPSSPTLPSSSLVKEIRPESTLVKKEQLPPPPHTSQYHLASIHRDLLFSLMPTTPSSSSHRSSPLSRPLRCCAYVVSDLCLDSFLLTKSIGEENNSGRQWRVVEGWESLTVVV